MVVSKLNPFLADPMVEKFKKMIKDHHAFGLGVSWDKASQKITSLSLIVRDIHSCASFKRFAASAEETEVVEFFDRLPKNVENPDDGLHGNLFALKIDRNLVTSQAYYRRLGNTPVSFEGGQWFCYNYEAFSPCMFSVLKFPKGTEELFKIENKCHFNGQIKATCVYPIYSRMKTLGLMRNGFEDYFDANSAEILQKVPKILEDVTNIDAEVMPWVSFGETKDSIKAYFGDFTRTRWLLNQC